MATKTKRMNLRSVCGIAMITALYCVLSFFMKFILIGNIRIDLGYIALAAGCILYGPWGAFVGAVGCGFESMLLSAYGFSISWFVGNLIIGLITGYVCKYLTKNLILRIIAAVLSVAVGIVLVKTLMECFLFSLPFEIKVIRNLVAFVADSLSMAVGMILTDRIRFIYDKKKTKNKTTA